MEDFAAIYEAVCEPLCKTVAFMLNDDSEAKDFAHEAFLQVLHDPSKWQPTGSVRAWIFQIAIHKVRDLLRRKKRVHFESISDDDNHLGNNASVVDFHQIDAKAIEEVIDRILRDPEREPEDIVIFRMTIDGYSAEEIGQVVQLSSGAVRTRLYRLRQEIRDALNKVLDLKR